MADLPISGLTTLTTYSTSDLMEILDVSDTTFSAFGTNKKVTPQNLFNMAGLGLPVAVASGGTGLGTLTAHGVMLGEGTSTPGFATTGTAGNVLTDNGPAIDPTFKAIPNATYISAVLPSNYTITTTFSNTGLSITLPTAGIYLIMGSIRMNASITGTLGNSATMYAQLYDSTNSTIVPNSNVVPFNAVENVASTPMSYQQTAPIGPIPYSVSGPAVIQLQASYSTNGTASNLLVVSGSQGWTTLTAIRLS